MERPMSSGDQPSAPLSCTMSPPTTVSTELMLRSCSSGTTLVSNTSAFSTARSAKRPGAMPPRRWSSLVNQPCCGPHHQRSASVRDILSAAATSTPALLRPVVW